MRDRTGGGCRLWEDRTRDRTGRRCRLGEDREERRTVRDRTGRRV